MAAFETFRKRAVTVFIDSDAKEEQNMLSPIVLGSLRHPSMKGSIPKLVATSAEIDCLYDKLSYTQIKSSKNLKKMKRELLQISKGEKEVNFDPEMKLDWAVKGKPGYSWRGAFKGLENEKAILLKKDGSTMQIALAKMSPPSAEFARKLAGQATSSSGENSATFEQENWTNHKGKTIKATFISLEGEQLTLKLANGKTTSLPLSRLSETSTTRARELAGN